MNRSNPFCLAIVLALLFVVGCNKKEGDGKTSATGNNDGVGAKSGGVPASREGQMFLLGQKLSQAAMVNGRADAGLVARMFKAATTVADITLKMQLEPLPAPTGKGAEDGAAGLAYLLKGQGKALGERVKADFGEAAAATYELAVKLNMLPSLYIDDASDSMGDTMADVVGRLATRAKLPDTTVGPLIAKLKARAPMAEVTGMALDLNESLPIAIATIYENDDKPNHK